MLQDLALNSTDFCLLYVKSNTMKFNEKEKKKKKNSNKINTQLQHILLIQICSPKKIIWQPPANTKPCSCSTKINYIYKQSIYKCHNNCKEAKENISH